MAHGAGLVELDRGALGEPEPFDAAVIAGNVLALVAPDAAPTVPVRDGAISA